MRRQAVWMLILTTALVGCASSGRMEALENRVAALEAQDRADADRMRAHEEALEAAQATAA